MFSTLVWTPLGKKGDEAKAGGCAAWGGGRHPAVAMAAGGGGRPRGSKRRGQRATRNARALGPASRGRAWPGAPAPTAPRAPPGGGEGRGKRRNGTRACQRKGRRSPHGLSLRPAPHSFLFGQATAPRRKVHSARGHSPTSTTARTARPRPRRAQRRATISLSCFLLFLRQASGDRGVLFRRACVCARADVCGLCVRWFARVR
jgi:hypothetical protein